MRLINSLRRHEEPTKIFVIGLDCAAPELVFHCGRDDLPNQTYLKMLVYDRSAVETVIDEGLQHLN